MQGFPKHLNSRHDYEYIRSHFPPGSWEPEWRKLLDDRHVWRGVATLAPGDAGIDDATHRVVASGGAGEEGRRVQQELVENANARVFRIGFTFAEVLEALGVAEPLHDGAVTK